MMRYTDFQIHISKDEVIRLLDGEKSSLREELEEELSEMLPEAYERLQPEAFLGFGDTEGVLYETDCGKGPEALYVITTIGEALSSWSNDLFQTGDCVKAMLADAIADHCLFQMDRQIKAPAIRLCRQRGCGIKKRLEAPQDAPMEIQKKALFASGAADYGLEITEGLMYRPVKSACQVFLLSNDKDQFFWEHDCRKCPNTSCRMRRKPPILLEIRSNTRTLRIQAEKGACILDILREWDLHPDAPCGGRGTCGKCKIRLIEGNLPVTPEDQKHFTEQEQKAGMRLACRAHLSGDCIIQTEENDAFYIPESQIIPEEQKISGPEGHPDSQKTLPDHRLALAVDIGTTTVAMELIDLETGNTENRYTALNSQRQYGADVISRIQAADQGNAENLRQCIREILQQGISSLIAENEKNRLSQMVIGANTTMVHLLMGYPCSSLGVFPFTPYHISLIDTNGSALLGDKSLDFDVHIFPGVSAYVGGDITAGLYALDFHQKEEICVLIDLGTNGEMAVGNKDKILAASAAAGPAFEGGNITCGTGSIPGAVCGIEWNGHKMELQTISGEAPKGICGTGIIAAIYELKKAGIMDETGRLEEPWDEDGFPLDEEGSIRIFQKDIREIQLAKAAVRAGLETLLLSYGISAGDVDAFYIAGGFGCELDIRKASGIGLLPQECEGKAHPAGNTSLNGARKYLLQQENGKAADQIAEYVQEIPLSTDLNFQQLYMEYMYFGEEE